MTTRWQKSRSIKMTAN